MGKASLDTSAVGAGAAMFTVGDVGGVGGSEVIDLLVLQAKKSKLQHSMHRVLIILWFNVYKITILYNRITSDFPKVTREYTLITDKVQK